MKKKIVGICMLLITAAIFPAAGAINKNAESTVIIYPYGMPNDTNFSKQWSLHNTGQIFWENMSGKADSDIDAPEAWDIETGSLDLIVAIVDTGVDYTHPDLASKIWNNIDETPGNGLDDDANGYIDDIRGWDFSSNSSDPIDMVGHGTMCAGVVAASSNNGIGIAGVCWMCTIMPLRIYDENWYGTAASAAKAVRYAADNGADVISMSIGWGNQDPLLKDAVNYAYSKGIFMCAAAGNLNMDFKIFPAAFDNVTAVAATNQNDGRCTPEDWGPGAGSSYGAWVDIAAPGNLMYSTMPTYHVLMNDAPYFRNQFYDYGSGCSYSTPTVAGVAALLLSKDPSLTPIEIKTLICETADPYDSTEYIGTGRVNAHNALIGLFLSDDDVTVTGGFGVKVTITNNGAIDLADVSWQIHVEGGILGLINKTMNGSVNINPGGTETVSTGLFLGLGSINITARVAGIEKTASGFILGPFVLGVK